MKHRITFLYGRAGSGKSTAVTERIIRKLKEGHPVLLLVPEQEAVLAERRLADAVSSEKEPIPTVRLEVLNFRRLANRVFRTFGGLSYNYIGKGARSLIMWQALVLAAPQLTEYSGALSSLQDLIPLMLSAVKECKNYRILPCALGDAAKTVENENPELASKLRDIQLIYSYYEQLLHAEYDDPEDDLTRLESILSHNNAFEGYSVFMDSFHGFTPQEFSVIRHIFRQADEATVTIGMAQGSRQLVFDTVRDTAIELSRLASEVADAEILRETVESGACLKKPALTVLEKELFTSEAPAEYRRYENEAPEGIGIAVCPDAYAEAEYTARSILRTVRETGCRFRDVAVIMHDPETSLGIIDAYFEKYGIPYFIARREELSEKPLVRLILSALAIRTDNWRADDVISYLKTGLVGISPDDCDVLESYAYLWNINGSRWHDKYDWTMNPDGYKDRLSDAAAENLSQVNRIRRKAVKPLTDFFEIFGENPTVRLVSAALYRFLCDLGIPALCGSESEEETVRLWNCVMDALDQLVSVLPDLPVTSEQYAALFTMLIRETDIGHIPQAADAVVIGSASMLRTDRIRHAFLLGVNEGVFPANVSDNSIFSDHDKLLLENLCHLSLSPDSLRLSSEELYCFYRAASCASESVTFSYPTANLKGEAVRPSMAITRICKLFPALQPVYVAELPPLACAEGYDASFELSFLYANTPVGAALTRIYREDARYLEKIHALFHPISETEVTLDKNTVSEIFPYHVNLTQSRLDSFVGCAFSFWGRFYLGLDDTERYSFRPSDSGTFIHRILESFMQTVRSENGIDTQLDSAEIARRLDRIVQNYLDGIFGSETAKSSCTARLQHTFFRMKRSVTQIVRNLLDEFSQSRFVPRYFELKIAPQSQHPDEKTVEPILIPVGSGKSASLCGQIDRVDTFKSGEDVYVRVVDYKTGRKDFNAEDLREGLNLQLMLYLFTLSQTKDKALLDDIGVGKNGKILPAGVLYYGAHTDPIPLPASENTESILASVRSSLKRSGLLTNRLEILRAMEADLGQKFIPVSLKKDQTFSKRSAVIHSENEFDEWRDSITKTVTEKARQILAGKADIRPLTGEHNPCAYCPLKPLCRSRSSMKGG